MDELIERLLAERYGPGRDRSRAECGRPDTPEVQRERQRVLAAMPSDEVPQASTTDSEAA